MNRLERLREQLDTDLARIEDGYADAQEADATDPLALAQMEGMISAYRQIIADAT